MTARIKKIACLSAIVLVAMFGLLFLAVTDLDSPKTAFWILPVSTIFGQTSLAAAWCAVGPFSLARRLALSSVWLAAIVIVFGFNGSFVAPKDIDIFLTFGVIVLVHWALTATPLWLLATWQGLRFDVEQGGGSIGDNLDRQIGIREAMVLTTAVAVVFGAANFRSDGLSEVKFNWEMAIVWGFLTAASVAVGLPLVVILLYVRSWLRLIVGALLFVAAVTALELSLVPLAFVAAKFDPFVSQLLALSNFIQSLWIITVIALLRLCGFSLISKRSRITAGSVGLRVGN